MRRETGKEQMVRVHYDEGVAIHIGPESCGGGREAVRDVLHESILRPDGSQNRFHTASGNPPHSLIAQVAAVQRRKGSLA